MDKNNEFRIQARAYSLWEQDGCPPDLDLHFWLLAEQEVLAEEADAGQVLGLATGKSPRPERVEQAARQVAAL